MSRARSRAARKKAENLMYLGPTITGVVRHGTVFKDGKLPPKVQECVEKFPAMARLFVSEKDMPEAVKQIHEKQGVLWSIYVQTAHRF